MYTYCSYLVQGQVQVGSKGYYDHGWASWVWGVAFQATVA